MLLAGPASIQSQRDAQEPRQPAVRFGVEVNYVEVDVVVVDNEDRFVRDLMQEDFEVYEAGKLQEIASFTLVDVPVERPKAVIFAEEIEPDIRSNTQMSEGRVYLLVLDDLHTDVRRSIRVKQAAQEFIRERLGTNDIAAVAHTSGKKNVAQEFTSSKRLLLMAVDGFMGIKLRSATLERLEQSVNLFPKEVEGVGLRDPAELERAHRARNTLRLMAGLSEGLTDVHGRRKAMVYVGEGFDYNTQDVFGRSEASSILEGTQRLIGLATRANVAIYTIDPRGLAVTGEDAASVGRVPVDFTDQIGMASIQSSLRDEFILSQDSLRTLSEETGGFALLNQTDYSKGLSRIVEENSHYYLLGYYPTNSKQDGKYRNIEVKLKRSGLEVRARKGYLAPGKRDKRADITPVDVPEGGSPALNLLVQSPLPLPEIPMRASASHFRIGKNRAVVPLVVEMDIDGFGFEDRDGALHDTVEFSVVALGYDGKVKGAVRRDFQLSLKPNAYQIMSQAGFRAMTALELPSGKYQLRMVAFEKGAGRGGTLFYDLEIPKYDESDLVMAPLVVTSEIENRVPVIGAPEDRQKALLLPSTRRTFSRWDRLWLLSEVYPRVRPDSRPSTIEITTALKASDEQAVFNNTQERGGDLAEPGEGIIHRVDIPLSGLAPGDYLIEIKARDMAGGPEEVVQRILIEVF
jgi:VWFA-related protein